MRGLSYVEKSGNDLGQSRGQYYPQCRRTEDGRFEVVIAMSMSVNECNRPVVGEPNIEVWIV
jgi:hypothetical protein